MFDKQLDVSSIAHELIDKGYVAEAYTLVLLQQNRELLNAIYEKLSEILRVLVAK